MSKRRSPEVEGLKRTGRVGLWVALPPVGLWRSVRHGKERSEDRLAEKIAGISNESVTTQDHSKNGLKDVRSFSGKA